MTEDRKQVYSTFTVEWQMLAKVENMILILREGLAAAHWSSVSSGAQKRPHFVI